MHILVTVPNMHWIRVEVAVALLRLLNDKRYRLRFEFPSHKPYENNQHHIVNMFRESDCEFWLSIDADNPPLRNPLDLVSYNKDIVGLPTPVWHNMRIPGERVIYWNVYEYDVMSGAYREYQPQEGWQQVDAIGTGCFMVHRRVFEVPGMQTGCFQRKLNLDGTVEKGNDISFCERAREEGFKIWANFDYPCRHYSELDLVEIIQAGTLNHG